MRKKTKLLRIVLFLLLAIIFSLPFLPSIKAKYNTQEDYHFTITKFEKEFKESSTKVNFIVPKTGYYILQALGGEGGGALSKGTNQTVLTYPSSVPNGSNQPVNMCIHLTEGQTLSIWVGGGGCNGANTGDYTAGGYGGGREGKDKNPTKQAGGNGAI